MARWSPAPVNYGEATSAQLFYCDTAGENKNRGKRQPKLTNPLRRRH
jgi:hypothetical protein